MPNPRPLDALRARLLAAAEPRQIFRAAVWGNPRVMTEALRSLARDLGSSDGEPPADDQLKASLRRFESTQEVSSFTELKYVCYGVTVPVGENQWRVIDRRTLFDKLLALVQQREAQPKQFRRCYQGLLSGYFGFDRHSDTPGSGASNWKTLRGFLGDKLGPVQHATAQRGPIPDWLLTLISHRNLLTDDPCSRYAKGLLLGNAGELNELCAGLGIASSSWVWDEALMAYVRTVCEGEDRLFHQGLPGVLKLVNGQSDLKLAQTLATQATAMTVARYSRGADKPEHPNLRDTSLHWIGNPWLNRTAWDAHVKHEPARQMVEGWLKRRLIKDFFELLAQDGGADLRRLNYWLKWEPQITDMWFVLGGDARRNRSEAFVELRKRMAGRDRAFTGSDSQNNAFVMRIGPLLVIEFGMKGYACYVYAAADFRTNLEGKTFRRHDLQQSNNLKRLSHMSGWESNFDYELKRLLQSVPASKGVLQPPPPSPVVQQGERPGSLLKGTPAWQAYSEALNARITASPQAPGASTSPRSVQPPILGATKAGSFFTQEDFDTLKERCAHYGIEWEDNRPKKGALWVLLPDRTKRQGFSALLDSYGFRYTAGKGFWLKD